MGVDPYVGQRVIWIEDGSKATVISVIDEGVGVYELRDDEGYEWIGFTGDFWLADD